MARMPKNGMRKDFLGTRYLRLPKVLFILSDHLLYIVNNMFKYMYISECLEVLYELPFAIKT